MAPDGRCKFGDASGDGYVRSEGVGLVVLKALDATHGDGDRIYAVIRGSAINNDGRSSGSMGTPSRVGQEELLRAAYDDAGIISGTGRLTSRPMAPARGSATQLNSRHSARSSARDGRRAAAPMSDRSRRISVTRKAPPGSPA